jgi:phage baseplate assembly protein gpV
MNESFAFSDLCRRVANLIRIGKIVEIDGTQVKVQIGKVKTNWLPIVSTAGDTNVWIPITIGESVAVFSPYGEMAQSFVIRSLHYNKYAAPENKDVVQFKTDKKICADVDNTMLLKVGKVLEVCNRNEDFFQFSDLHFLVSLLEGIISLQANNVDIAADCGGRINLSKSDGELTFFGNKIVVSEDGVRIEAGSASITLSSNGIQLKCGGSTIDISDSNISLNSSSISSVPPICKCDGGL